MSNRTIEFIFNYVSKDKTQSALMLTSPWGTGKSYFINNKLSNYLKDKDIKCIVVSLYGLNNLQDLSKAIFIESKLKTLNKKSSVLESTKIVATTIAKGIASFWGININISERQLQNLYKSLNFSKTLLILEDLERSDIEIKKVLGYVNNLVEHDGAKVLLVANEYELLKNKTKVVNNETKTVLTNKSKEYLSIKEKTVGDTIHFDYVSEEVLENIVFEFNSEMFRKIIQNYPNIFSTILNDIMNSKEISCKNLRAFKIACQKTIDLFNDCFSEFDCDFLYLVFLGNVAFCLKKSKRDNLDWDNNNDYASIILGTAKYPLFKIGYWYIQNQINVKDLINIQYKVYKETKEQNNHDEKIKKILGVIYDYYHGTEKQLTKALNDIREEINNNKLPVSEYLKLANFLISIKENIPLYSDIVEELKTCLLNSMNYRKDLPSSLMLLSGIELGPNANKEYESFSQKLNEKLSRNNNLFDFDYTSESFTKFENYVFQKKGSIVVEGFMSKLDLDKFIAFLKRCNAREITSIRRIFSHIYNFLNADEYFHSDYDYLQSLRKQVDEISKTENQDKIINLQLKWFVSDLDKYLMLLKKEVK